jgi:hypothetical protein
MIELACKEVLIYFNKKHLEDPKIPMWVLRVAHKVFKVNHISCYLYWRTVEFPGNVNNKGAIKVFNALLTINNYNCATLEPLKFIDKTILKAKDYTRILITLKDKVMKYINEQNIKYTPLKEIKGSLDKKYYVCDIENPDDITLMQLSLPNTYFRILQEDDVYYKIYNDNKFLSEVDPSLDDEEDK